MPVPDPDNELALEHLEALIIEGLDSPLSEMTSQDWVDLRREGLALIRSKRRPQMKH